MLRHKKSRNIKICSAGTPPALIVGHHKGTYFFVATKQKAKEIAGKNTVGCGVVGCICITLLIYSNLL